MRGDKGFPRIAFISRFPTVCGTGGTHPHIAQLMRVFTAVPQVAALDQGPSRGRHTGVPEPGARSIADP
ncbi:hypothetical protein EES43_02615 [Streptomyces sp. ADI96-02]|nr:hypothetical protein EES43_02615 [Streptomyces sp. ADI96-02]